MKSLKWLLVLGSSFTACQQTVPLKSPTTVLVRGSLFSPQDTAELLTGLQVIFTRRLANGRQETVIDSQATGHYQVRLTEGVVYVGALKWRTCEIEKQEIAIPSAISSPVMIKKFYMPYPDSTHYGGCLAGWENAWLQK
jgi:hypothetical protein